MPLAIFGLSLIMLCMQLVLMRILSFTHGYHLATVVISVALLGIGAGGSFLAVWRHGRGGRNASGHVSRLFPWSILLCGVFTALLPWPLRPLLAGIEVDLLLVERGQWLRLIAVGGVLLLPFLCGALALAVAFSDRAASIGQLYAANLAGSAIGALAAPVALTVLLPERMLSVLGGVAILAALPARAPRRAVVAALLILAVASVQPVDLPRSPYKDISYALQLPDARREGPYPHPRGRLELVTAPAQRYAPDLSLRYRGEVPAPPHLFIDGGAAGVLLMPDAPGGGILAETPRGLPFAVTEVREAVLLDPGGTAAINLARAHGARVTAAVPHPHAARHVTASSRAAPSGSSTILTVEPRLLLARMPVGPAPDLIVFPERGQFGGPMGLQALGEDYLFTVEAVALAFDRLAAGGHLAFSVWLDEPLRHAPRILDLAGEGLRAAGVDDPAVHVLIVRGWGSFTLLAGREPVTQEQVEAAMAFAEAKGFDLIWPVLPARPRLHEGGSRDLDGMIPGLLGPAHEAFHARTRFELRAPRDRRPFFNQFLRPGDRGEDLAQLSLSERGLTLLRLLVLMLGVAAALLVLGPLIPLRAGRAMRPFTLLYFAGLGGGFMVYEVALIQRFILLLGDPVAAVATVIAALLAGMSAGSLLSRRLWPRPRMMAAVALAAGGLQLVVLTGLMQGTAAVMALPTAARYAVALLTAGLPAVVMGMPFPLGVRLLSEHAPDHIPWACGIDGALAVLAVPAAGWLALLYGFHCLPLVAGACYLLAALSALWATKRGRSFQLRCFGKANRASSPHVGRKSSASQLMERFRN